jgi:hypothetical protein
MATNVVHVLPFELDLSARSARSAPRWHIDHEALDLLEATYTIERFPNVEMRTKLGERLHVSARQVRSVAALDAPSARMIG